MLGLNWFLPNCCNAVRPIDRETQTSSSCIDVGVELVFAQVLLCCENHTLKSSSSISIIVDDLVNKFSHEPWTLMIHFWIFKFILNFWNFIICSEILRVSIHVPITDPQVLSQSAVWADRLHICQLKGILWIWKTPGFELIWIFFHFIFEDQKDKGECQEFCWSIYSAPVFGRIWK